MEFLYKKDLEGSFQTKFHCSAAVICFDVSPQLDYMVCECQDDTIQLWSLHTGKQLWKRHFMVTKRYLRERVSGARLICEPYRTVQSTDVMSFYRSVVFHPTENVVLPGILSQAYTIIDGELKPLFPSSRCRFSVCSIGADKTKMLTDCPDNAKLIIMWKLTDGSEISHFAWNDEILSFAWSPDERLLAVSDSSCSISLVDAVDGFKTLAQITSLEDCGMIKFSPDCQFLFCRHCKLFGDRSVFRLHVSMGNDCKLLLEDCPEGVFYYPWEFESCSESGFLLGDPFYSRFDEHSLMWGPELAFVLNKQSVLRVSSSWSVIEMLNPDELTKDRYGYSKTAVKEVVFSLDGDTLYVVTVKEEDDFTSYFALFTEKDVPSATLKAWSISSEKWKAEKDVDFYYFISKISFLVAVRAGILLKTSISSLELWNDELSECIRSWTDVKFIMRVIPISEELVACVLRDSTEVVILDTASGNIVSTIAINGYLEIVACNSKLQVLISLEKEGKKLQMQCGEVILWTISPPFEVISHLRCNTFSPTGQYCVFGAKLKYDVGAHLALYFLDVASGKQLRTLCTSVNPFLSNADCKFVSDEECVISIDDVSSGCSIQLFNVKSGDLLSKIALESEVCSLAVCPRNRLIAVGLKDSKDEFKVLKVKLPRYKDCR